jgi:hypothetical protein
MTYLCHPLMPVIGNPVDSGGAREVGRPGPAPSEPETSANSVPVPKTNSEPAEPDSLAEWIEEQAAAFKLQQTQAGQWMAETMLELAATARFLGAATPEQFETRKQTLECERFSVRPCPKVVGRYQAWDIIDGRGKIVRACTDLFDAMMWIQQQHSTPSA